MMKAKTLILVRHAKSSWELPLDDFDRPLNERGKRDAPEMGKRLREKKIKIDAFISSPAKRAKKTARLFVKEFDADKDDIIYKEELYHASENAFYHVIEKTSDKYNCIAIFSHNPGITDFANSLSEVHIDNIPTSGVFAVTVQTDKWSDIKTAAKNFLFFDYPKAV